MKFITERGEEASFRFNVYNAFGVRSIFRGSLRELSRITHQLGKCDLEPKSGFPDATGSHPLSTLPPE